MTSFHSFWTTGDTWYTGAKQYVEQTKAQLHWRKLWTKRRATPPTLGTPAPSEHLAQAQRALIISSVSLGLATLGVLGQPLFGLASVPLVLYLCRGRFQVAYQVLRHEHRITPPVLDATRVVVCVVMGYDFIAALDAWLQTVTQKMVAQSDADFQQRLGQHFGNSPDAVYIFANGPEVGLWQEAMNLGDVVAIEPGEAAPVSGLILYGAAWVDEQVATGVAQPVFKQVGDHIHAASVVLGDRLYVQAEGTLRGEATSRFLEKVLRTRQSKSYAQQWGETSGERAAPYLIALFAVAIPFWGVNRAAAFLTASLGSQMRTLGPFAFQNFVNLAAQQGILLKDGRVLERACLLNTLIIDAEILTDPAMHSQARATIEALRRRRWPTVAVTRQPFTVYLLAVGTAQETTLRQLTQAVGADDYLLAASPAARAELLAGLRSNGHWVGYVGAGATDPSMLKQVSVAIAVGGAAGMTAEAIQVVLTAQTLAQLNRFFDLATDFAGKEAFNLGWPFLMDIMDISTTVFFHFGLAYSILFNYAGLLVGAVNTRMTLRRDEDHTEKQRRAKALPVHLG